MTTGFMRRGLTAAIVVCGMIAFAAGNASAQATAILNQVVQGESLPVAPAVTGEFDNGVYYIPGKLVDVAVTIARTGSGPLTDFTLTLSYPESWPFHQGNVVLPLKQDAPPVEGNHVVEYSWGSYSEGLAGVPLIVHYQLEVPVSATGPFAITAQMTYRSGSEPENSGLIRADLSPDLDYDNDGLPNDFEDQFGLDKFDATDLNEDPDGDSLTNLQEYLNGTNPNDPNDPGIVRFVAPNGSTRFDDGRSPGRPWNLAYALSQFPNTGGRVVKARLLLAAGLYAGDFNLTPFITLQGQQCSPGAGLAGCSAIQGTMEGAEGATLDRVVLVAPGPGESALHINNIAMTIASCGFVAPTGAVGGTGITLEGQRSGQVVIGRSQFARLAVGLDVFGPIPRLARSAFADLDGNGPPDDDIAGIILEPLPTGIVDDGTLSSSTDPNVGYNTFDIDSIASGIAVINRRATELLIQNNDWGTDDLASIEAAIAGEAQVEPILAAGTAIFAAALFCTLTDGDTNERITNGSIRLVPSGYLPVSRNVNGVYGFSAIGAGAYEATAEVPGYDSRSVPVEVAEGALQSLVVSIFKSAVPAEGEGEGEGEGEPVPPGPICCQQTSTKLGPSAYAGDMLVGGLALSAMLALGQSRRKRK